MVAEELLTTVLGIPRESIVEITPIYRGFSNRVYQITLRDGDRYKVRIAQNNEIISRSNEFAILSLLGDNNCIYYDRSTGNGIWRWVGGRNCQVGNISNLLIRNLVDRLRHVHSIAIPMGNSIMQHDDLEYFYSTRKHFPRELQDLYLLLVNRNRFGRRVLCHNDISPGNLILGDGGHLTLIDYEWGRINSPYWEYGNFIKEFDLSIQHIKYLLRLTGLQLPRLMEYAFMATMYSIQLSFLFSNSQSLNEYRSRLFIQLGRYRSMITP